MAWTVTAFYVAIVIVLGYRAAPYVDGVSHWVLFILIAILGLMTFMFVNMQFEMRWEASDTIEALRRIRGVLSPAHDIPDQLDTNLPPLTAGRTPPDRTRSWPNFIRTEIANCQTNRLLREFLCATCLLFTFRWRRMVHEIDPRIRSELPSYAVLLIATIIAIATLWVRNAPASAL